jgi:hypothetical protein
MSLDPDDNLCFGCEGGIKNFQWTISPSATFKVRMPAPKYGSGVWYDSDVLF